MHLLALIFGLQLFFPSASLSQVTAVRLHVGEAVGADGQLDETVWQRAPVHDSFYQREPWTGGWPAPARTTVQIAFDDAALYFAIRAYDPQPEHVRAPFVRHDKVLDDQDHVVVFIDAAGNRRGAQFFRVSARGARGDGIVTSATEDEDDSPDFDWDAAAALTEHGYSVELRIPYAALRYPHRGGNDWQVIIARHMPREQLYWFVSADYPLEAPSVLEGLRPLVGFSGPPSEVVLQIRPTLTARRTKETLRDSNTNVNELRGSLDFKLRPRADWVFDGTLNPDFSQVELDVPQLSRNTQFALSLTEKRPFFLESSDLLQTSSSVFSTDGDLFQMPSTALYTRAVTDPSWGLRATYRGDRLAGTALTVRDDGGGRVLLPGPFSTGEAVQPRSLASMARVRWHGDRISLGVTASDRTYVDAGSNRVIGPDMLWRVTGNDRLRSQWLASWTDAWPDASGRLQSIDDRYGTFANVEWNHSGEISAWNLRARRADSDFRNDNGFYAQTGYSSISGEINRQFRNIGSLNELTPYVFSGHSEALEGGERIASDRGVGVYIGGRRGLELDLSWRPRNHLRVAAGSELHTFRYWRLYSSMTPGRVLTFFEVEIEWGERVDVDADRVTPGTRISASTRFRIGNRFELEPSVDHVTLRGDGGGGAYEETAGQLIAVTHLSARDWIRLILQSTRAKRADGSGLGPTAFDDRATTGSLVYSHRFSNAQVLYLGATRQREYAAPPRTTTELFAKLQFEL